MTHKINSVQTKDNFIILATFLDGTIKQYDLKQMFPIYPLYETTFSQSPKLFKQVQIDTGGYGLSWNDDLDIDAETIWYEGDTVGKSAVSPILELASKLTEARSRVGMTQKQLAETTGIYQADISKIERGLSNPSVSTLQRLADGMGLSLNIDFK